MSYAYGLLTMYDVHAYIGIAFENGAWTYAELADGIENVTEALNEQVQQYFFLSDNGFGKNHITGMAPAYTFTGKRIFGDAAQDYIFSKKFALNGDRRSSFKFVWSDGTNTHAMTCHRHHGQRRQDSPAGRVHPGARTDERHLQARPLHARACLPRPARLA